MSSAPTTIILASALLSLAACGGGGSGSSAGTARTGPRLEGQGLYLDVNGSSQIDAGDRLVLRFDRPVALNGATVSEFELSVIGDDFGTGAVLLAGQEPDSVEITLGSSPVLRVRGENGVGSAGPGAPSGIALAAGGNPGAIVGAANGRSAVPGAPIDLAPGFFNRGFTFGPWSVRCLASADLNGDGILDLAVGNGDSEPNRILFGLGDGSFQVSGQGLGAADTQGIALGDLDGDGDVDLVAANHGNGAHQSAVWSNDGAGSFQFLLAFGDGRATSVALGDLDRDGDLDLVEGRGNGQGNQVWRNDGAGGFSPWGDPLGSNQTHTVLLADLDRDGDLDLLEGNSGRNRVLFWNLAAGAFVDSGQRIGSGSTRSIAVSDLDCDGDQDLVIAGRDPAWAWRNDGDGFFRSGTRLVNAATDAVALADFDGDGRTDVVAGNANRQANEIWYLGRQFQLKDAGLRLGQESTRAVVVGDFDRDGDIDFVAGNDGELSEVWFNSLGGAGGDLRYAAGPSVGDGETSALIGGDMDGDGRADLVEGEGTAVRDCRIWIGLGDGAFHAQPVALGAFPVTALLAANLRLGGRVGVLQAQDSLIVPSGESVVWSWDSPSSSYTASALASERTLAVAAADVDGDGDLDLFRGNDGAPESAIWWNDGAGILTRDANPSFGPAPIAAAAFADLDRDGDPDLVVSYAADGVRWFSNQGGAFLAGGHLLAGQAVTSLALGDLDRDGVIDLVAGTGAGVELRQGDGLGGFGPSGCLLGALPVSALAAADLDGDGDLDLVVGRSTTDALLWLNDGAGSFVTGPELAAGDCSAVVVVDLNCDGVLDLVFADHGFGGQSRVWIRD